MDSFHKQNNKSYRKQDKLYYITILNAFVIFLPKYEKEKNQKKATILILVVCGFLCEDKFLNLSLKRDRN